MTVTTITNRNNYVGNDSTATYSYTFRVFLNSHFLVTVVDTSDDSETTLALTTDYTVTGVGESGGSIVLVDAAQAWISAGSNLDTGFNLVIRRVLPVTQETDIRNQGDFFPEVHEDEFDKGRMVDLQQQDEIDRSVKLPESVDPATFDASMPPSIVGQENVMIMTNTAGDGFVEGPTATEIAASEENAVAAAASAAAAALSETAAGTSETNAGTSETNAAASAAAAAGAVTTHAALTTTHGVSGAIVGTTDAQTLTNKTIDDDLFVQEIAEPSTPASGYVALFAAADGAIKSKDDAGVVRQLNPLVAYIRDEKATNTDGGTFTLGAWRTRDLNNTQGDTSIVSVSSNQFTLQIGTYLIEWSAPAAGVSGHKTRLRNITDSTTDSIGHVAYCVSTTFNTRSAGQVKLTITAAKTFEIQHDAQVTQVTRGFGSRSDSVAESEVEIYTQVKITKVA